MSKNPYRQDRGEIRELLKQYENLRSGKSHSFIDEDSFEAIIEYFEEKEDVPGAITAAEFAIEQYPYSSSLLIKKADLLITTRKYNDALDLLDRVESLGSQDINLYILKTDIFLALDQQEKAVELLEEAIQHFDGEEKIELLFELSDVYDDYEEFDKVFDCLKMILEQEPINEEALYKICFWTDFTGRNEESIKLHKKIIEDYPYSELAWFNLAAAYQGLKLYEKSIDAYQYAIAIDEKFDYAYRNMGDAYIRMRKYKDAIEMLEKVLELNRPEDVIYEAIGHCYDRMKNFAQARFYYRKASHLNTEDSKLYYKIACTYINEGQWESAIKQLQSALEIHRLQPEYNQALGECLVQLSKYKEAIEAYSNVIRQRPKNVQAWTSLLECFMVAGMLEDAGEYADMAYRQTKNKPVFLFYRSSILFAMGKSKEAMIQLEIAMEKAPRLIKKFIALNPQILQNQQVVDLIARYKRNKSF
ncbi:MAG: tetratricopeptide repeat protein [Sphingobacteriales bacterium]|nr:MAG: tetratricopeptide repeat protein [Sphingobacteriales bacterium]